jgi:MFS transporter, DHA2 family, multidrug resistance protein
LVPDDPAADETALTQPAEFPEPGDRLIATCGLMVATAIQAADAVIVNVALPQLQHDLGGGIGLGAWVITSYLCATAVVAPLTGWLRRRYGARRLFPSAVCVFAAASVMCGLAPSVGAIILFRIVQGAAGGVIHPLAQAILLDIYPKAKHAQMLAILGAGVMAGPILGPVIGGLITDLASWRWAFAINVPLGLFSIWCVTRLRSSVETPRDFNIDVLGILLLTAGVAAFQLFLQRGIELSWFRSPEILAEAVITIAAFTVLALRARGAGFTAFRPEVFKDLNFVTAAFYNFMLSAILFVTIVLLPALGEGPLGFSAALAGSTIVPRAILMTLVILFVGQSIERIGYRFLLIGGWVLMGAGLIVLSGTPPTQGLAWIIAGSAIQAVGAGMLYTPLTTLAFSTLAPGIRTDATGLYSLLRQLGYASGVALMSAVLQTKIAMHSAALSGGLATGTAPPARLIQAAALRGYADCFTMMAIAAFAIIPGVFLFRIAGRETGAEPIVSGS